MTRRAEETGEILVKVSCGVGLHPKRNSAANEIESSASVVSRKYLEHEFRP